MRRPLAWLLLAPWLAACGSDPAPTPDATTDRGADAVDVASDAPSDLSAPDATPDASPDATTDALADASGDAADASDVPDATGDVSGDAGDDVRLVNGCPTYESPIARMGDDPMGDTYAGFARDFFQRLCLRCHGTTRRTPEERMGAPSSMNWDDDESLRGNLSRIRRAVGVDNYMPLTPPLATCTERRRLVRWVDLGAP